MVQFLGGRSRVVLSRVEGEQIAFSQPMERLLGEHLAGAERSPNSKETSSSRLPPSCGDPGPMSLELIDLGLEKHLTRLGATEIAIRDRRLAVIRALRLFKDGSVSVPGILHFSDEW